MRYFTTLTLLACGFIFAYASTAEGRQQRPNSEDMQAKREAFKERLAQFREQHGEGQGGEGASGPCRERMEAMRERMEEVRERIAAMRERRSSGDAPQGSPRGEAGKGHRGSRQQGPSTH